MAKTLSQSHAYVMEVLAAFGADWWDDEQVRGAAAAHYGRSPAYITKQGGSGSDAKGGLVLWYANRHAGILNGLAQIDIDFPHPLGLTAGMLDRLIPLNAAAVRDLKAAYSSLGTFRDRGELEGRNPLVSDVTEAA